MEHSPLSAKKSQIFEASLPLYWCCWTGFSQEYAYYIGKHMFFLVITQPKARTSRGGDPIDKKRENQLHRSINRCRRTVHFN
jgi:hypothetical protein